MHRSCVARSFLLALLISAGIAPHATFACSCASSSLEDMFERSENVFTAVITGGISTSGRVGNSAELKTSFEVTEAFKGNIPFEYFGSHADGNSCGISLQVGVEYLIFAPNSGAIGLCSGIVAVSDLPEGVESIGAKYVAALRAFKSGRTDGVVEPWQFIEYQGICTLSARFPYRGTSWPGNISAVFWTRVPEGFRPDLDKPHLKPGFTELSIWVPGRDDLSNYPMTLSVNKEIYQSLWTRDEYSRGRYLVSPNDVPALIAELESAATLRMKSDHPEYGEMEAVASLANAGDSVSKMVDCINSHQSK